LISIVLLYTFSVPYIGNSNDRDKLESELIAAEIYSFGLESILFELREDFKSRNDVFEFFRQGFGPSLSEKLTNNIWIDNQVKLKAGDKIMDPPKSVKFKSITTSSAIIAFETPEHRKHIWGNSEFTELVFKKEGGRWKLFQKEQK